MCIDRMASVLVSRFLLDLQDAHQRSIMLDSRRPISTVCVVDERTISFVRMAGSLGATIDYDINMADDFSEFERDEGPDWGSWVMDNDINSMVDRRLEGERWSEGP